MRDQQKKSKNQHNSTAIPGDKEQHNKGNNEDLVSVTTHPKGLAASLMKLNLLVATWPLLIFLGQNATSALLHPRGILWTLEMPGFLVLSALFAVKGFRCRQLVVVVAAHTPTKEADSSAKEGEESRLKIL